LQPDKHQQRSTIERPPKSGLFCDSRDASADIKRAACDDASPTVLQSRLSELREAQLVELISGDGYHLTAMGKELFDSFLPLHHFAERWGRRVRA
jgi:DNA-binding HxlR family transcriptional regulator